MSKKKTPPGVRQGCLGCLLVIILIVAAIVAIGEFLRSRQDNEVKSPNKPSQRQEQ